jgi:hypothetical protein
MNKIIIWQRNFFHIFAPLKGEMAEWSKAHAWKVCNRQKRFMGSNPILSAAFGFIKNEPIKQFNLFMMGGKWNLNPLDIFGIFMVVIYIVAGLYIIFGRTFYYVPSEIRTIFGIFLILYGIFRGARIYINLKNPES